MSSQVNKTIIGGVVAALLAGGGYVAWQKSTAAAKPEAVVEKADSHVSNDTISFPATAPQLDYLQIKPVDMFPEPLVEPLNGRLAYDDNHTARIFPPIAGRVLKITADTGHKVKAGEELLVMDAPDYAQATADVAKANADLVRKRQAFERAQQLVKVNGISLREMEATEGDFHLAEAEAQRAEARLHNLQSLAKVTNGKFVLRSPVGGTVSERQVNVGSEVRPDATNPLFVVTDSKQLWALIDLPERYLDKVKVGQPVSVEVDAYPGEAFNGKITVIAETLDPVTRRIQVRAEIDNAAHRLKPEMFVRATPDVDSDNSVPRVPNSALFTMGLHAFVFVEKAPGVLQRRRVELGLQSHEYSYVKSGLQAGERVVTSGALLLNAELAGND